MTKEEIIDNLKYQNKKHYGGQSRTLIEAIKLIEQPTSDDCVSRQAVLDLMQLKMGGKELYKAVYDLPPVTPTHKIGKWIMPNKYYDKNIWRKCSVCNTHFEKYHKYITFSGEVTYSEEIANYCKVCGAEMVGCENG